MNNKSIYVVLIVVVLVLLIGGAFVWHRNSVMQQYGQTGTGGPANNGGGSNNGGGNTAPAGGNPTTGAGLTPPPAGTESGNFNTLTPQIAVFAPNTLSGIPKVGYQGGDLVDGKVLYYPWATTGGGGKTSLEAGIISSAPQGVMLSYNADTTGFTAASKWTYFDMTKLTTPGAVNATGYNGAAVAGDYVYLVPDGHQGGKLPTFVQYNASKAVNDPTAYQTVGAPARGGELGNYYGWCMGIFDGTYIYYVPGADETAGYNGNIIRYDTRTPFSLSGGGWSHFDMGANLGKGATSYQSGAYDGHRYIYYVPFRGNLLVRYDTQYGTPGTPNPDAFTNSKAYTTLDPTHLGTSGFPTVTGDGDVSNLKGFTGAQVVWDSAHQNEYLYMVPWAFFPNNVQKLMSTAARVRIGTQSGSTWNYVDVTGADTASPSPQWELYDLNNLTTNPQWAKNGWPYPAVYPSTGPAPLVGQSLIAGFQLSWVNTAAGSSPRVGFGANDSQFWVEQDVSHALSDPTGWYVAKTPTTKRNGTFGGAYDAAHQILYPAAPATPLLQVTGL